MNKEISIRLFDDKKIRVIWNKEEENWYFSVEDVVLVLTDSVNVKDYIKKMRKRNPSLSEGWGQIVTPLDFETAGGKQKINFSNTKGILRIIQSIPSKKAEPFKMWLAQVGSERIDELADPELTINRALETYKKKGYSDSWINQRLKSIEVRKDLTDEWDKHGVKKGLEYAILTDEITKAWSDNTTKEYKQLKGLKKENLRDNMTNMELILNMLAEATTTEISKEVNPETFEENKQVARRGGNVAGNTRKNIEKETGKKVITSKNAKEIIEKGIEKRTIKSEEDAG